MKRSSMLIPARFGFALLLFGCGGHTAKYKFDDVALASVPMSDKQAIFAAEQEVSVAKAKRQAAEADVRTTEHEVELAKLEREQAKLATQTAKLEMDAAEKSHDMNRQGPASEHKRLADLGERAANAKVDMLDQKRKWQNELVEVTDAQIDAAVSHVEVEKAKLAAAKNIRPTKDFNPEVFTADFDKRTREVDDEKREADEKKEKLDRLTQAWKDLDAQYQQAKTVPGISPASTISK